MPSKSTNVRSMPNIDPLFKSAQVGAPNLEGLVTDYYWRPNHEKKIKEHVRRSDGFVVGWKRMTPEELGLKREPSPRKDAKEKIMSTRNEPSGYTEHGPPVDIFVGPEEPEASLFEEPGQVEIVEIIEGYRIEKMELSGREVGQLTVKGYNGTKNKYRCRQITVVCSCGRVKHDVVAAQLTHPTRHLKSCGHLKRGKKTVEVKVKRGSSSRGRKKAQENKTTALVPQNKPVITQDTIIEPTPIIGNGKDFRRNMDLITAIAMLSDGVSIEEVEELAAELDRRLAAPPLLNLVPGIDERLVLTDSKRTVTAFLEFKRRL